MVRPKVVLLSLLFAVVSFAQLQTINPGDLITTGPTKLNNNFNYLNSTKTSVFTGSGAPGSISASGPGSVYADLTNSIYYVCFSMVTCTGVGTGNWEAAGKGSVTDVTSGNLSPLFTVSIANGTTTPAFTFGQVSQLSNLFYASPDGTTGNPAFRAIQVDDVPTLNQNTTGNAATATALQNTPTVCTYPQFSEGIATSGNSTCATPGGLFTSYQFGTQTALTGAGIYLQTTYPTIFSLAQTGSGTSGAPYIDAISLASETQNTFFGAPNGSNGAPTFRVIAGADLPSSVVQNNQTNTGTSGMTIDLSAATSAGAMRVPNISNPSNTTGGTLYYDTAKLNLMAGAGGASNIVGLIPSGVTPVNGHCPTYIVAAGEVTLGDAACATGAGTVTDFTSGNLSPLFTASVATATVTPALTFSQVSQSQNLFYASPNGSSGNPIFRAIASADLPTPGSSSLGGVQSAAPVTHQWVASISTSGVPSLSQPSFTDVVTTAHNLSVPPLCVAASGSTTTYTCLTTPTFSPAAGDIITFCPDLANTGASTLSINSTPAATIRKIQGTANLAANDLQASPACVSMIFDGTYWEMQGQLGNTPGSNPTGAASGDLCSNYPNPTVCQVEGAAIPASVHVVGTNGSSQVVASTAADISAIRYVAGGGTGNAQTATYSPALTSLSTGTSVCWLPSNANSSTTPTFAPNGLTAKTITKVGGAALAANDIVTTAIACAMYDGTDWELQNPQTTGSGVTSVSGDGTIITNSGSSGSVTLTLGNAGAHKFLGNNTATATGPAYDLVGAQDVSPNVYAAGGGSANAQTVTLTPAVTSLVAGLGVCWLPTAPNSTTTPTLAVSGLTAKTITKLGQTAVAANDLTTTAVACAIYDGTDWELQNPQTSTGGGTTNQNIRTIGASFSGSGSALTTGTVGYITVPFACTIAGYNIQGADAGTVSFDVWKIATGTANPTVTNTILTGGYLQLSTGTAVHSTSTSLFTSTTSSANDIYGFEIEAVSGGMTKVGVNVQCNAS